MKNYKEIFSLIYDNVVVIIDILVLRILRGIIIVGA